MRRCSVHLQELKKTLSEAAASKQRVMRERSCEHGRIMEGHRAEHISAAIVQKQKAATRRPEPTHGDL